MTLLSFTILLIKSLEIIVFLSCSISISNLFSNYEQKKYNMAVSFLEKAVKDHPNSKTALHNLEVARKAAIK